MKVQTLVATMNQKDYKVLKEMNIQTNAVIINQTNEDLEKDNGSIKWINTTEIGLSKSRNMALKNSNADIGLIADDDLIYVDNYEKKIVEAFEKYPKADIITFQVEGIEKKFKNYYSKERNLNYLTSMKVSSVEIAFRVKNIKKNHIKFNELFGSGAKYFAGEENIFLYDCLKKGLKIQYVPIKIANLHIGNSTWFKGFDKEYFIAKGAIFTEMSRMFSEILILQFAIRKYNIYKNEISLLKALKFMRDGKKEYLLYEK